MRKTVTTTAVALSAAALTLGLAGTAHAERYATDDPQDTAHGSDITGLEVRNGQKNLHVVSFHENLRRSPLTGTGGTVFIDTDPDDQGPEYMFTGGFTRGTDYVLSRTEGFGRKQWGKPVRNGDYIMRVRYHDDRVHITMSRAALGDPTDVRVAMRASGSRSNGTSEGLTDWVGGRRSFSHWIGQGR